MTLVPYNEVASGPSGAKARDARLFIYESGTDTEVQLYKDADGLVQLVQPLRSDTEGRFTRDSAGHTFASFYVPPGIHDEYLLDSNGRADAINPRMPVIIPSPPIPGAMTFKGGWNASSNTPTLADGTGTAGDLYRVTTPGTRDLGSGSHDYEANDEVYYDGSIWDTSPASSVRSINGRVGAVTGLLEKAPAASATNLIQPTADAVVPVTARAHSATQSAALFSAEDSSNNAIFRVPAAGMAEGFSTEAVTSHIGGVTVAAHTSVFRADPQGNVLIGPNRLITSGTQQSLPGWDPDYSAADLIWSSHFRRLYTRSLSLWEVGDPPDLILGRWGPDGGYPEASGTAASLAGIPATTNLGTMRWAGGVSPGAVGAAGAKFRGTSAAIYVRAAEDFVLSGGDPLIGGHMIFATTPTGTPGASSIDRLRINASGKVEFGSNFDTNLYSSAADTLKTDDSLVVAGAAGVTVSGSGIKNLLALTSTSGTVGMTLGGDTNIYRLSAGNLKTDGSFQATNDGLFGGNLRAFNGLTAETIIGDRGPSGKAGVTFGTASDTNLFRDAADTLKTSDSFHVGADFRHLGTNFGVFGHSASPQSAAYTNSSGLAGARTLPASFSVNDLAKYVINVVTDLQGYGLLG